MSENFFQIDKKDVVSKFKAYAKKPRNEVIPMPDYEFFKSGLLNKPDLVYQYFQPAEKMVNWFALDSRSKETDRKPNSAQIPTTKGCTAPVSYTHLTLPTNREV